LRVEIISRTLNPHEERIYLIIICARKQYNVYICNSFICMCFNLQTAVLYNQFIINWFVGTKVQFYTQKYIKMQRVLTIFMTLPYVIFLHSYLPTLSL